MDKSCLYNHSLSFTSSLPSSGADSVFASESCVLLSESVVSVLSNKDVVRHPLVQKIVEAYETYEKTETQREHAGTGPKRYKH